jgi:hypothetical protein
MSTPRMRVLLVHPGAAYSTADVEAGLRYGLEQNNVEVIQYRLDGRILRASSWVGFNYRKAKKLTPELPKPTQDDVLRIASEGVVTKALRLAVNAVVVVSGFCLHPDTFILLRRAGVKVVLLLTETPYNLESELDMARLVDGCWTNERSCEAAFREVNPNSGYLPLAWHPERHRADATVPHEDELPRHDVVFVGSGFHERAEFFNAIDWTGIDLGLYGTWPKDIKLKPELRAIAMQNVNNGTAAALYRRAKIGLNLYRTSKGFSLKPGMPQVTYAESLSPRAYELAACGVFHLSHYRAEVSEVFGDLVPTFRTPAEAESLIRRWLPDADGRARIARALPACVAESSWTDRAVRVIGDIESLCMETAAVGAGVR